MAGPYHLKILRASTLEAAKLQARDDTDARVPPWISVFILFGALGALVFLFTLACWFARTYLGRPIIQESRYMGTIPENDEVVAQKMRDLDGISPAKTLQAWKKESCASDQKDVAQATSVLVCAICLDTLAEADVVRELGCHHIYHSECIVKWYLNKHETCPLCKSTYVAHKSVVIAVPPEALRRARISARDDALLRYYQTVAV